MAMALAIRAACTKQASRPLMLQLSRLGSTQASGLLSKTVLPAPAKLLCSTQLKSLQHIRPISTAVVQRSAAVAGQVGHHAKLWTVERVLSAGLLFALPACIAFPSQPLDLIVAVTTVMHAHWGLEAIVVDYVRPILVGNVVPKLAHALLIVFSAVTLGGLVYFIQNDVGIGQAVRKIWAIKHTEPKPEAPKKK